MKTAIVYDSITGNTAYLARALQAAAPGAVCAPAGQAELEGAELVCLGFWTDRGSCSARLKKYLPALAGKRVFLFGTAGFGTSPAYFRQVAEHVREELPPSCVVEDWFMCAGQMPETVRRRYAAMAEDPMMGEKGRAMLAVYDAAVGHPDAADAAAAAAKLQAVLARLETAGA